MQNFKEMVEAYKKDFVENPLDNYDSYTYSLEWFVVNRLDTIKFQKQEALLAGKIANDEWPEPTTQYVTIAKTGYTTEFNITNLTIDSVGVGNSNYSKIAGSADKLEFTCTQVGNTSLADTLQVAIALCGYKSISEAIYFMKINFLGNDSSGKAEKLPHTKVMPFKIRNYNNVNTSSDARGTTTVLAGQVDIDSSVTDTYISTCEYNFNYLWGDTVEESLNNFFAKLKEKIVEENAYLHYDMKNEYSYEFSDQFKEHFAASKIDKSKKNKGTILKQKNDAEAEVQVMPGQNIYQMIEEVCLHSEKLKKELTSDNPGYTKVLKIIPQLALKPNGFNPIKGTQAYEIKYFIDYQLKIVEQNMTDFLVKIKNNKANCLHIFENGHVHKKYDYLFTGNNDQVLNFEISLQAELIKTYLVPGNSWLNEDFRKNNDISRKLSEEQKELIKIASEEKIEAEKVYNEHDKSLKALQKRQKEEEAEHRDKILAALPGTNGYKDVNIEEQFGDMTFEQIVTELKIKEPGTDIKSKKTNKLEYVGQHVNAYEMRVNQEKLKADIKKLQGESGGLTTTRNDARKNFTELNNSIAATNLWAGRTDDLKGKIDGYKSSTAELFHDLKAQNTPNIILAEELGDDYITTMSNDDFRIILEAQAQNPIKFERILFEDDAGNVSNTSATQDKHIFVNAQAKYMEAKNGEVSMYQADMTIKGDPFFIEGYMPASTKKKLFENGGTIKGGFVPVNSNINGFPHIVIESGKARGTDIHDNVIVDSMILSLYAVKSITSDFSNGIFTQTLSMVKNASAENFVADTIPIGVGPYMGFGEGVDYDQGFLGEDSVGFGTSIDYEQGFADGGNPNINLDKPWYRDVWDFVTSPFGSSTEKKLESAIDNSDIISENTTDTLGVIPVANPSGDLGKHTAPLLDNIVRRNNALDYIESTKTLTAACKSGVVPQACTQLVKAENELLATIGVNPQDKGKATTVTAVNNYFNGVIADPQTEADFMLSAQEVAAYQMAVGGELNVTGHDPADIQKIVKEAKGERTPKLITEKLSSGTYNGVSNEQGLGAAVDNSILSGTNPLINEEVVETLVNIPVYTWEEQMYNDQINYPNSNNDWKNTHWFKSQVDAQVAASKVVVGEKVFNPKTRRLEIKKIPANTLTVEESNDVKELRYEINKHLNMGTGDYTDVTSDDVAEELYEHSSGALVAKLLSEGVPLDEVARITLEKAQKETIVTATRVDTLSDEAWEEVQLYADGINKINENASTGIRGDLTDASNTKTIGENLTKLSSEHAETKAKTDGYYFDKIRRDADKKKLEEVETAIAKDHLLLPDETTTFTRTVTKAGNIEYIPVKNPVKKVDVELQPILVKTPGLTTLDVILPSARGGDTLTDLNVTNNEVAQLDEARKVYKLITSMEYHSDTIEVDDEWANTRVVVKDFNNIPSITYKDANGDNQTISNPSAYFGLYTRTFDDSNPAFINDYGVLKKKISELFPGVTSGRPVDENNGKSTNGVLEITIRGDEFYIDKTE